MQMQDLLTAFGANGMVGGTLRQALANAKSLDFNSTGCIDLSTLNCAYNGINVFVASSISYIKVPASSSTTFNGLCTKYQTSAQASISDKMISFNGNLYIVDTAYTDVAAFKEALKGQLLAYEKA